MSAIGWALIVLGLLIVGYIIVQAASTTAPVTHGTGLTGTWRAYPPVPSAQTPVSTFKVSSFYTGNLFARKV